MQQLQTTQDYWEYDCCKDQYVYHQSDGKKAYYSRKMTCNDSKDKQPKFSYGIWQIILHAKKRYQHNPLHKPVFHDALKYYCKYHDRNTNPLESIYPLLSYEEVEEISQFHKNLFRHQKSR